VCVCVCVCVYIYARLGTECSVDSALIDMIDILTYDVSHTLSVYRGLKLLLYEALSY
jgi:hypothetical protein